MTSAEHFDGCDPAEKDEFLVDAALGLFGHDIIEQVEAAIPPEVVADRLLTVLSKLITEDN